MYLSITSISDAFPNFDTPGDRPLDQKRKSGSTSRRTSQFHIQIHGIQFIGVQLLVRGVVAKSGLFVLLATTQDSDSDRNGNDDENSDGGKRETDDKTEVDMVVLGC